MLPLLADLGAPMGNRDVFGRTPAHLAAWNGHTEALRILARVGCPMTTRDSDGFSPADIALKQGHDGALNFLTSLGAFWGSYVEPFGTVAHAFAAFGQVEGLRLAVDYGIPMNVHNEDGDTPVDLARRHGHGQAMLFLMSL